MRKPNALRLWLLRCLPFLAKHPEKLHLFIEEGRIACVRGESLSYKYHYDLVITVEDMAASSDALIVPLLSWIAKNQPDLLTADGLPFDRDILSNDASDMELRLSLSETALVEEQSDGGWKVTYPDEEPFPDIFDGVDARLKSLWLDHYGDHFLAAHQPGTDPMPPIHQGE